MINKKMLHFSTYFAYFVIGTISKTGGITAKIKHNLSIISKKMSTVIGIIKYATFNSTIDSSRTSPLPHKVLNVSFLNWRIYGMWMNLRLTKKNCVIKGTSRFSCIKNFTTESSSLFSLGWKCFICSLWEKEMDCMSPRPKWLPKWNDKSADFKLNGAFH